MKTVILLFFFFSLSWGDHIDDFASEAGYLRDYNYSLELAKKENKLLILVVVADFCPWCKKLERKTLMHENVVQIVEQNCIAAIVDKNWDKESFPQEFSYSITPAVYFLDPNNQKDIHHILSYVTHKEFLEETNKAIKLFKEMKK